MRRAVHTTWQLPVAAVLVSVAAAVVLLPLRGTIDNTNTALLLTIPVLAIAIVGQRWEVLLAAASAAVAFDFFHTLPYYRLTMRSGADVLTAVLLFIVGLISGELGLRARRQRALSRLYARDIARVHATAELVASGEPPQFVVITVAGELRDMLGVDDVRFERAPITPETSRLPTLDELGIAQHEPPGHVVVPREVALAVTAAGHHWGSYVLTAKSASAIPITRLAVAMTLAHQVAIAMVAASATPSR